MEASLKLAVVGAGWAGRRQCEAVAELHAQGHSGIVVTAIVEPDEAIGTKLAAEFGAVHFTGLSAALAVDGFDAVSICTPHASHAPLAMAAAQAGRHILVEKPMACSVEESTRMLDAAAVHGVVLYVAEHAAYDPLVDKLCDLLRDGSLGAVVGAVITWGFHAPGFTYPGRREWLTRPELGGTGTWMLQGVHRVAQVRQVLGEIASVYAVSSRTAGFGRDDIEGSMTVLMTTSDGLPVTMTQSSESKVGAGIGGWTVLCEHGVLRADDGGFGVHSNEKAARPWTPYPSRELSSYALELAAFAAAVRGEPAGRTTGVGERRTLAIVEAGYVSAASGQPVVLSEHFGSL